MTLKIMKYKRISLTCFTCNISKGSPEEINKWSTVVRCSFDETEFSQQNMSAFTNACKTAAFHNWH